MSHLRVFSLVRVVMDASMDGRWKHGGMNIGELFKWLEWNATRRVSQKAAVERDRLSTRFFNHACLLVPRIQSFANPPPPQTPTVSPNTK